MGEAIAAMKQQGAVIVDPADIPSIVSSDPQNNLLKWNTCSGLENAKGKDGNCSVVFKYGMKRDFNKWLESLGAAAPVKSLTELRELNLAHTKAGAIKYGQSQLDISDEMDLQTDRARYEADRAKDLRLAGAEGIDAALKKYNLDALVFPGAGGAAIAAKAGYPTVIVPFGTIPDMRLRYRFRRASPRSLRRSAWLSVVPRAPSRDCSNWHTASNTLRGGACHLPSFPY